MALVEVKLLDRMVAMLASSAIPLLDRASRFSSKWCWWQFEEEI